jgi:WD40 repeat protein
MTARLWDVVSGQEIGVLSGHKASVWSVAFSTDGGTVATASGHGTVRLWPAGQHLIDFACARVDGLPLSERDKERFGITEEWCTPQVSGALRAKLALE